MHKRKITKNFSDFDLYVDEHIGGYIKGLRRFSLVLTKDLMTRKNRRLRAIVRAIVLMTSCYAGKGIRDGKSK